MFLQSTSRPIKEGIRPGAVLDPAELARCVRQLAHDAHRALKNPSASKGDLSELAERIDRLRSQTRFSPHLELDRWLEKAREMIDRRRGPAPTRGLHLHAHG